MARNIEITPHAAQRYMERHRPDLSFDEAMQELRERAPSAARLKERTFSGEQLWQLEEGCLLVVKLDKRQRNLIRRR